MELLELLLSELELPVLLSPPVVLLLDELEVLLEPVDVVTSTWCHRHLQEEAEGHLPVPPPVPSMGPRNWRPAAWSAKFRRQWS